MQFTEATTGRKVGIYGWRKRCLYSLLLGMMVLALCSLAATLLLISILHFNLGGLGLLSISAGGVYLRDFSHILDSLVTGQMSSRYGHPLSFESSYNLSAVLRDAKGRQAQMLHFWSATHAPNRQEVTATASEFRVCDLKGRALFSADSQHVNIGADVLRIMEGGVQFGGSVQTSMVRSNLGTELMLESATRRLHVRAPGGVSLESRASDIIASCHSNLQLTSSDGQVKMKAPGIYIPNLESVSLQRLQPSPLRSFHTEGGPMPRGYQVCMCTNGKLFAAHPDGECRVDGDNAQCR